MTTAIKKTELNAIFSLAIGSTENSQNPYKFDDSWKDFQTSVVGRAQHTTTLKGKTFEQIRTEAKATEVVDEKTVPTAAAKDALSILDTVQNGTIVNGKRTGGMQNSGQTVGLGQFDFGGNGGTAAIYGLPDIDPLRPNETVSQYVVRKAFPEIKDFDARKPIVEALNGGLRGYVDGTQVPLTTEQSTKISNFFVNDKTVTDQLDRKVRDDYVDKIEVSVAKMAAAGWSESDQIVAAAVMLKTINQGGPGAIGGLNKYIDTGTPTLDGFLKKGSSSDAVKAKDAADLLVALKGSDRYSGLYDEVITGAQGSAAAIKTNTAANWVLDSMTDGNVKPIAACIRAADANSGEVEPLLFKTSKGMGVCDPVNGKIYVPEGAGKYTVVDSNEIDGSGITRNQAITFSTTTEDGHITLRANGAIVDSWAGAEVGVLGADGKSRFVDVPSTAMDKGELSTITTLLGSDSKSAAGAASTLKRTYGWGAGEYEVTDVNGHTVSTTKIEDAAAVKAPIAKAKKVSWSPDDEVDPNNVTNDPNAMVVTTTNSDKTKTIEYVGIDSETGDTVYKSLTLDENGKPTKFIVHVEKEDGSFQESERHYTNDGGEPILISHSYTNGSAEGETPVTQVVDTFVLGGPLHVVFQGENKDNLTAVSASDNNGALGTGALDLLNNGDISVNGLLTGTFKADSPTVSQTLIDLTERIDQGDGALNAGNDGNWGGEANHPVVPTAPVDPSDTHFTRYPPADTTASDPTTPSIVTQPPADATSPQTQALIDAQVADATTELSFANALLGLKNWGSQGDLAHLTSLVNVYNTYAKLTTVVSDLPGDFTNDGPGMGQFGAGLSFVSALQSGNNIKIASSGLSLYSSFGGTGPGGSSMAPFVNILNLYNAAESKDNWSMASAIASLFPPWGTVVAIVIDIVANIHGHDIPDPPQGATHFEFDAHGNITLQNDYDVMHGSLVSSRTAQNVLNLLQTIVASNNATNDAHGQSDNNLAIDPSRMPRIGYTAGQTWIETTHPDGSVTKEPFNYATIGERLLQIAVANDALVPVWQIQTAQAHAQNAQAAVAQAQLDQLHANYAIDSQAIDGQSHPAPGAANTTTTAGTTYVDMDGHAPPASTVKPVDINNNPSVFGADGKTTEATDHKTQTFDALVVHLHSPQAQQHLDALSTPATVTSSVLHDTDGDGFLEQTQWVAATDKDGNAQGMLVLDHNHNGIIDTADILHLGGDSNLRNSMAWLDSNADGVLDAHDPAFAAIKLFVDINGNGRVDDGELQSPSLSSINFTTGQVHYSDGQSDALTATTLTSDTDGLKLDSIKIVNSDGKLEELKVGSVIVHEGYEGQVRVNSHGQIVADDDPATDTHLVSKRTNSFEFNAEHQSDWEGTADQDQHRHGGSNVATAPTQTTVTGVSSMGPVLGKENVTTSTTMDVGDKRIISDAPRTQAPSDEPNTTITLNAGNARIRSLLPPDQTTRVVFVPSGVRDGWMTADGKELLQLPEDGLFGTGGLSGALTAVALGAVQTTAFAMPDADDKGFVWQTTPQVLDAANPTTNNNTASASLNGDGGSTPASTILLSNYTTAVHHVHLGVHLGTAPSELLQAPGFTYTLTDTHHAQGGIAWQTTVYDNGNPPVALAPDGSNWPAQTVIYNPTTGKSPAPSSTSTTTTATDTSTAPTDSTPDAQDPNAPPPGNTSTTSDTLVTNPNLSAPGNPTLTAPPPSTPTNTTAGTTNDHLSDPLEDLPLHVSFATLLANDTNASSITQVGNAVHGSVAIVGSEVVFTPNANYHGPASFQYQVVSTDGSVAVGQADFDISAVNDLPVAHGESVTATEDTSAQIAQATLLLNDTDVDIGTDNQHLSVSAVGHAQHGTVSVAGNGSIQFTPDANFHGMGSFDYVVSDGNGGTSTATATVQVAAVNDVPVALGEVITSTEDTTLLISQAALLANDTDADIATDNQVLAISSVTNAQHGTASILGNGQIQFVPDANYSGSASFDYVVSDGHGGTATTTATVLVGSTDDAPVASGETVNSMEDQYIVLTGAALLANETDIDNPTSSLQISRVSSGSGGTVTLSGGNVGFTPTANFSGTASFTYWVKDPDGLESNPATVTVNVAPVNDAPYAQGEVLTGASEDAVFLINRMALLGNDGDQEDSQNALSIVLVGNASSGTVALDGGGNVVYTPTLNFNGDVTFQYQVRDTDGALSPTVTAQFAVARVNDAPLGVDEQLSPMYTNTATSPTSVTIGFNDLLSNDHDVDNPDTDLTVSGVRNANNGTVSIVGGAVSFVPTLNFNGTASFEYQVDDQHGGQTWATAFISVAPPPNAYPNVNLTYTDFHPTGTTPAGAWDVGEISMQLQDDGNPGLVSITYIDGTYHVFGDPGPAVSSLPWNTFTYTQNSWYVDVPRAFAIDSFDTNWRVVDDRGLENIWHFGYTVGGSFRSSMQFPGYVPPVVLALDGHAPHYIETQYSNVRFDLNGDGVADQVAWAAPGSGVLGIDLNGDHTISNANEFSFTQYVPGAKTDLEGLRAFDSNHNGVLDAGDAQWSKFGVWEDKNGDGVTQDGEYKTLDALGIANINLNSHAPTQAQDKPADGHLTGVAVVGESGFTRTDGSSGQVDDAMLAFQTTQPAQATPLHTTVVEPVSMESNPQTVNIAPHNDAADLMRMALLFNQYSNTAIDGGHEPLGYVPIQTDGHWQDAALTPPPNAMHEALQGG